MFLSVSVTEKSWCFAFSRSFKFHLVQINSSPYLCPTSQINMGTSCRQEVQIHPKSQHWERCCKLMLAESLHSTARKTANEAITLSAQCYSQISISSASLIILDFSQSNLQSDFDTRHPTWGTALWRVHQAVERLKEPQEAKESISFSFNINSSPPKIDCHAYCTASGAGQRGEVIQWCTFVTWVCYQENGSNTTEEEQNKKDVAHTYSLQRRIYFLK